MQVERNKTIILTIDVDYAFPSRIKGFIFAALGLKIGKDYLRNARIIARMINDSNREIRVYWFFTPATTPDQPLLDLMGKDKHEIGLHVASDPIAELRLLERATNRKVRYYTIHGTERLLGQIIWKRRVGQDRARIPKNFSLKNFYDRQRLELDVYCYRYKKSIVKVLKLAENHISAGTVIHIHPEWLFKSGLINYRGPIYEPMREILQVDKELTSLSVRRKVFANISRYSGTREYEQDFVPNKEFIRKLADRNIDVFTFLERSWCFGISKTPKTWLKTEDNVALLEVTSYSAWLEQIGKKTRNMVRKAEKSSVKVEATKPSDALVEGIWKIYNETPTRQERAFPHYGQSLEAVRWLVTNSEDTFIAAWLENELVGFIQLVQGYNIVIISQILSLQTHSDKAINNALIAKAVEFCASKGEKWLMYARMGNHPSLDTFKQNNGFTKFQISRYYVPATEKGRLALRIGLYRDIKDILPGPLKYRIIPVYNWVSRAKIRLKPK